MEEQPLRVLGSMEVEHPTSSSVSHINSLPYWRAEWVGGLSHGVPLTLRTYGLISVGHFHTFDLFPLGIDSSCVKMSTTLLVGYLAFNFLQESNCTKIKSSYQH